MQWETIGGFQFKAGSIFDTLKRKGVSYRLYAGDDFPMVAALKGISLFDIHQYSSFTGDLSQGTFPYGYVFIEPSYDVLNEYRNSTSQHPLSDVILGEALIKETYEAIRNSALWNASVLIITWDKHGGFYDHVSPPAAVAPGDSQPKGKYNQCGFTFEQYGPRVPTIVISPFIAKNTIDHRLYDHASVPAGDQGNIRGWPAHRPRRSRQQPRSTAITRDRQAGCADDLVLSCHACRSPGHEHGGQRLKYGGDKPAG